MSIKVSKEKIIEAKLFVNTFKSDFYKKYGFNPLVIYEFIPDVVYPIPLIELEDICNSFVDFKKYKKGIKTVTRKRDLIVYRQLFMHIAYKMSYKLKTIGNHVNREHSLVIHSYTHIKDLLESRDVKVCTCYKKIEDAIKQRIRINALFQSDIEGLLVTKPILSA